MIDAGRLVELLQRLKRERYRRGNSYRLAQCPAEARIAESIGEAFGQLAESIEESRAECSER